MPGRRDEPHLLAEEPRARLRATGRDVGSGRPRGPAIGWGTAGQPTWSVLGLQRAAGNAATVGALAAARGAATPRAASGPVPVQRVAVQRLTEEQIAAITRLQALVRARRVREQVRVRSEAPGVVGLRVRGGDPGALGNIDGTPLKEVRDRLGGGLEYNHLRVLGGAEQGAVLGPGAGERPRPVADLAAGLPPGTAVVNGGYFAHTPTMRSEESVERNDPEGAFLATVEDDALRVAYRRELSEEVGEPGVGRPVGPTSHRGDHIPIPEEYAPYYGQVTVGGQAGLNSGALLTHDGNALPLPDHDRFRYRVDGEPNVRNDLAGALTHAGDPNARSAVSTQGRDVLMHAVTHPTNQLGSGVTLAQWRELTAAAAGRRADAPLSTLNLDGGGSVFLGVTEEEGGVRAVAKARRDGEAGDRPVGNIVASRPPEEEGRG